MPTEMISLRDYSLHSLSGHCVNFEAGKPMTVPDVVVEEALKVGIVPTDQASLPPQHEPPAPPAPQGAARTEVIKNAIQSMVDDNDSSLFGASGAPRLPELKKRCGFEVSPEERDGLWKGFGK